SDLRLSPSEGGGGDGAFRRSSRTRCGGGGGRWHVAQRGSQAFWGQHRQRRALGGALQSQGRDLAGSDGGRSSFRSYRGPSRLSVRSHRPPAGHDAAGNTGTPDRQLRRAFLVLRALALFRSPWAHLLKKGDYIVDTQRYNRQKKSAHAEEQQRSDVLRQRRDWFAGQLDLDPTRLVFIDETWASTNMARKRGRCRRGQRLRAAVPHGHYKTVTLVAGLRLCGLVAQKAFDRPINAASFDEWVEKCLVPTLSKGDIVVMDNLSRHKGPRVEQLIKAAGAELRYLPPYSPDMSPIEKAYSKLKAFLRKIAERTVAGLLIALDACADIFKPAECANYFRACGYDTG